jgi:hypothetical protein
LLDEAIGNAAVSPRERFHLGPHRLRTKLSRPKAEPS